MRILRPSPIVIVQDLGPVPTHIKNITDLADGLKYRIMTILFCFLFVSDHAFDSFSSMKWVNFAELSSVFG